MNTPAITLDEFYQQATLLTGKSLHELLPAGINKDVGHFNVFDMAQTLQTYRERKVMPYNKRAYYKISLVSGHNIAEYADRVIEIEKNALVFATPKIPYHWVPQDYNQAGYFCVFTDDFMLQSKTGVALDELPIFKAGGYPVFQLNDDEAADIAYIFGKMNKELSSDYAHKYDLLRNYVLELVHYGQKLQPATALYPAHNAAARVTSLFVELLERQFPIESPQQRLQLRTANAFAERLAVHVNHLNKVLKENTGKTTTTLIAGRIVQEAKILLKQTDWTISEIGFCLGFEEVAHFSNFFKKQTQLAPINFRA